MKAFSLSRYGSSRLFLKNPFFANVGNSAIQEVAVAVKHYNASKGVVVATSFFTKPAIELARSNGVDLINRSKLEKLIHRYL